MLNGAKSASGGKKINFIFGVHNHQPVGNFDNVFELAAKQAYGPFLDVVEKHPNIKIVFHYTGCLIDWLEKNKPEILDRLKALVKKGQAEILTGGYYEPILPLIPDDNKFGQIRKMTSYIKKRFSYNVKGLWLAERVWEPSLAKVLNEAGVEFVVLDDAHFLASGLEENKLRGYFITEEQGFPIKVFPISQDLRYLIPFSLPEKSIDYLRKEASENPSQLLVMADDGEKFGLWPDTYKTCYEKQWLEKFFTMLDQNSDWITTSTFSEYLKKFPARGRVYIPATSYFEMGQWSLPAKAQIDFEEIAKHADDSLKRFLKGGIFRNFLAKYPESNNMHKKMLYVAEKIKKLESKKVKTGKSDQLALDSLYRGQCNCAYWHGVFGGLYLPFLRSAIYKNLIEAEEIIAEQPVKKETSTEVTDIDRDSCDEIIFSNKTFSLYIKPSYGGAIYELDFKPSCINLVNTLTRRPEAYHRKLEFAVLKKEQTDAIPLPDQLFVKEDGLKNYLRYDWYNRYSLMDHFLHPSTTQETFSRCDYGEQGDFTVERYSFDTAKNCVKLERKGSVWVGDKKYPLSVKKIIGFLSDECISFEYELKNPSAEDLYLNFAAEFNIAFSSPDFEKEISRKSFTAKDKYYDFNLEFLFSEKTELWTFPVYTVSISEAGFEKMYQETAVMPTFKIKIPANTIWKTTLKLTVTKYRRD